MDGVLPSLFLVVACAVALWLRSYCLEHGFTFRSFLTETGYFFVGLGQRFLDAGARDSQPPVLTRIRIAYEKRTPMEIERRDEHVVVRVPGRIVKLRRVH